MQVESSKERPRGRRALVVAAVVLLAGCKLGGTDLGPPLVVHQVTFPTHVMSLVSCQAATIQPTVSADTGALTSIVWSSKDSTIADLDSIGHIHALAPGSTLIRATAFADSSKHDTLRVTVTDPTGPFVTLAGIQQASTGNPADYTALHDSVDVVLHVAPLGCRKKGQRRFVSADVVFAGAPATYTQTFAYPSGISGSVYLRVNTARLDSTTKQPILPNGGYYLTSHVTSDTGTVYATSPVQVTVSNP